MKEKKFLTREYSYTVIYEPVKEGGFQVTVPLLYGLLTYGRDFEEAREMARDAIQCYIGGLLKEKERIPKETGILQEKMTVSF